MSANTMSNSAATLDAESENDVIPKLLRFHAEYERRFSYATALLKYGRHYEHVKQHPASLQKGPMGECFANCARAVTRFIADAHPLFHYAEGYALDSELGIPYEHAWLVNMSGQAIDLTWKETENAVYYGVTFKPSFVQEAMRNTGTFGILGNMQLHYRLFESEATFKAAICKPTLPGLPIGKHR